MENHSLSHTTWECVYHVVWIPKYRRRALCGEARGEVGEMLRSLVDHMEGVEIVEGSTCSDHVHICLRVAPKHSASGIVGRLKGKCSILLHERRPEWRAITGRDRAMRARGCYVSSVGPNEEAVRRYIRTQEEGSAME